MTRQSETHVQAAEQKQLLSLLAELIGAVEELLLAGLTAASKSTVERIDVTFKEASRMKLLRLGSTLRIANEEISRFTTGSTQFSSRRLAFFLGRAWVLATSMRRAIEASDNATLDRLLATSPTMPVEKINVVTLGVVKRVVPGAFAAFDFRLRAIDRGGEPLIWSCVFPMRRDLDLPAEAFLHLPQKQKWKPSILLEKKVVEMTKCGLSRQPGAAGRLSLSDASTVNVGEAYSQWEPFWKWDFRAAAERLEQHKPTPLDLEIELQEEVFLDSWRPVGESKSTEEGYDLLAIETGHLPFEVRLDRGPSGTPLYGVMTKMAKAKKRPALYGVAHYEACRVLLQPLTVLGKEGPEYLTISPDKVSQAELVKAMKFT
jgi:hypothetical protein